MPRLRLASIAGFADSTCTIHYIARRLGRQDYGARRLINYVSELQDKHDFPPPFPADVKGRGLTSDVRMDSRWRRDAVDHWIDSFLPPELAHGLDSAGQHEAAAEMDARATRLRLVGRPRLQLVQP